jgi:hypothetical protein
MVFALELVQLPQDALGHILRCDCSVNSHRCVQLDWRLVSKSFKRAIDTMGNVIPNHTKADGRRLTSLRDIQMAQRFNPNWQWTLSVGNGFMSTVDWTGLYPLRAKNLYLYHGTTPKDVIRIANTCQPTNIILSCSACSPAIFHTLRCMSSIESLFFINARGTFDITPLATFPCLRSVTFATCTAPLALDALENVSGLTALNLYQLEIITDLSPLHVLTSLTDLRIVKAGLHDFSPIGQMTTLRMLEIRECNASMALADVRRITSLTDLRLENWHETVAVSPSLMVLSSLRKLTTLHISLVPMRDGGDSWISQLTRLEKLTLTGTNSDFDFTALVTLPALNHVNLTNLLRHTIRPFPAKLTSPSRVPVVTILLDSTYDTEEPPQPPPPRISMCNARRLLTVLGCIYASSRALRIESIATAISLNLVTAALVLDDCENTNELVPYRLRCNLCIFLMQAGALLYYNP